MALYEFRCPTCDHRCEVITPTPSTFAEFCVYDGDVLQRVYSPPSLRGETVARG